jgi:hypothetical protein
MLDLRKEFKFDGITLQNTVKDIMDKGCIPDVHDPQK